MEIEASIKGIRYTPFLCKNLNTFPIENIDLAMSSEASFILQIEGNRKLGVSWWVSPKRTRSYPYARVYNTFGLTDKKVTIIPIYKDEGKDGDRDFLQWDTISLMSLLEVNVIIAYYNQAEKSLKYSNKITNQRYDYNYIVNEIKRLLSYQSSALHWNIDQLSKVGDISDNAFKSYEDISKMLNVEMHSSESMKKKITTIREQKESFMNMSRNLSRQAQYRESQTIQPKEEISEEKATITIKNYLGGLYHLTVDEAKVIDNRIILAECKHSAHNILPSIDDIKDGLVKMVIFSNLSDVCIDGKQLAPLPTLKLTSSKPKEKNEKAKLLLETLNKEAKANGFIVKY